MDWDFPDKDTGVGAVSSSRGSSRPRYLTHVSCTSVLHCRQILYCWPLGLLVLGEIFAYLKLLGYILMLLSGSHVLFCFLSLIFRPTISFRNWFLESKCSSTKVHHIHKMISQAPISDNRTFSEENSIGLCPLNDLCIAVLFKLLAFWSTFENISCVSYNILYFSGTLITKSKFLGFFCFQCFFLLYCFWIY